MQKNAETIHFGQTFWQSISQPFLLILVGKELVQVYHFSFISPQFTLTENLPIT